MICPYNRKPQVFSLLYQECYISYINLRNNDSERKSGSLNFYERYKQEVLAFKTLVNLMFYHIS